MSKLFGGERGDLLGGQGRISGGAGLGPWQAVGMGDGVCSVNWKHGTSSLSGPGEHLRVVQTLGLGGP